MGRLADLPRGSKTRRIRKPFAAAALIGLGLLCAGLQAHSAPQARPAGAASVRGALASEWNGLWVGGSKAEVFLPEGAPYRPDWQARSDAIRKKAEAGMEVDDPTGRCFPPGFPRFWMLLYPYEFLVVPGQVTIIAEYFREIRRIFTGGLGHPVELEPSYQGHSTGRWRNGVLTVDTIALRGDTMLDRVWMIHSDQTHVTEQFRITEPGKMEVRITIEDPVAFTRPWVVYKHLVRAPKGERIMEYICEENNLGETYVKPADN